MRGVAYFLWWIYTCKGTSVRGVAFMKVSSDQIRWSLYIKDTIRE